MKVYVSIPSRRVGDNCSAEKFLSKAFCFHPLKAGRRLYILEEFVPGQPYFHPLKAGRRLAPDGLSLDISYTFPSPQGGSET